MSPCQAKFPDMEDRPKARQGQAEKRRIAFRVEKLPHEDPGESLPQGSPVRENLPEPEPAESLPEVSGDDRCGL